MKLTKNLTQYQVTGGAASFRQLLATISPSIPSGYVAKVQDVQVDFSIYDQAANACVVNGDLFFNLQYNTETLTAKYPQVEKGSMLWQSLGERNVSYQLWTGHSLMIPSEVDSGNVVQGDFNLCLCGTDPRGATTYDFTINGVVTVNYDTVKLSNQIAVDLSTRCC